MLADGRVPAYLGGCWGVVSSVDQGMGTRWASLPDGELDDSVYHDSTADFVGLDATMDLFTFAESFREQRLQHLQFFSGMTVACRILVNEVVIMKAAIAASCAALRGI